uniref:SpoVT-AbrB domain-containing protein n=1 Tax=Archaeoglobus fulgidus TaxID=2234 RepID=A0A7C3MCV7_ARCFL
MVLDLDGMQKMWENIFRMQNSLLTMIASAMENFQKCNVMQDGIAVFRAKVQSGGRISIPEPDRIALGLKDGEIVKVIVIKEKGGEEDGV